MINNNYKIEDYIILEIVTFHLAKYFGTNVKIWTSAQTGFYGAEHQGVPACCHGSVGK